MAAEISAVIGWLFYDLNSALLRLVDKHNFSMDVISLFCLKTAFSFIFRRVFNLFSDNSVI